MESKKASRPLKSPATQKTPTGHEIPVPKRSDFLRGLKRASTDADPGAIVKEPSKREPKPSP